ncbi:MAG TPA: DUF1565 domain-containing protein [Deltaproteobacteria bacterium]|nr:DUF1565 domain-containing protein [Deltaproteobacteria bacterium]
MRIREKPYEKNLRRLLVAGVLLMISVLGLYIQGFSILPVPPVFSAVASAFNASPQLYYVDVNGDDANDGSAGYPWKTISQAVSRVQAGDTVLINPGTHYVTKQISIATSGEAGKPITFLGNGSGAIVDLTGYSGRNGFEIYFADYIIIENLTVRASNDENSRGIRVTHSEGVILRNNTVSGAGHANLFCSLSDHILFEENEAYGGAIGIYVADSSDYVVVRRNVLHDNSAIGLHMNGDINSGGDGTISYAVIEGNISYNNGATGINCDGVTASVFINNLLYNNKNRGIAFFQQDGAVPSNDNHVYHNTIVMPSSGYYGIGLNYGANRNFFYNNIIYTEGTVPCFSSTSTTRELAISSDYNLLSSQGAIGEAGGTSFSFQQWQGLGYGAHSLEASATETFVNSAYGDFMMKAGSPAVDAGTATYSWPTDLLGNERPYGSAPDMGAYEFSGFCLNIDSTLDLTVSCAQYAGRGYGFTLDFFSNPVDLSGIYWKMDLGSFHETFGSDCINIGSNLSLSISCAAFSGKEYAFVLDYYPNSVEPSGIYWKMNLNTFREVGK